MPMPMPSRRARTAIALLACVAVLAPACTKAREGTAPTTTFLGPPDTSPNRASIGGTKIELRKIATVKPAPALAPRAGGNDLYVTTQAGQVRELRARTGDDPTAPPTYELNDTPVLDLADQITSGGERGLLGLAFSPGSERETTTTGSTPGTRPLTTAGADKLYVYYTDKEGRVTVDEYAMRGSVADVGSRRNLLSIEHKRANHNGGQLAFGPDGFLYIGTGDGGGGGDPDLNGQNPKTLLGKILRIDPTHPGGDRAYGIQPSNPYADGRDGAPEVWIYGVRNPWRFSFDRATGDLWIADVGQNTVEEIDLLRAPDHGRGANLQWPLREGFRRFSGEAPADSVEPIYEYGRAGGNCSVTGGYVYRGSAIPALQGAYLFGDYCEATVRALFEGPNGAEERSLGANAGRGTLASFGEDTEGELYTLSLDGAISRIVPA
jgi:glucose/arabinose dehydrogenase